MQNTFLETLKKKCERVKKFMRIKLCLLLGTSSKITVDALELKLDSDISKAENKKQSENFKGTEKNVNQFIL